MTGKTLFGFAAIGVWLVAICYGLARFAFGLFVPMIRSDLGLDTETIGTLGSLAYVGYCASILGAPALVARLGPRTIAVAAALSAATGMALTASSGSAVTLGTGLLLAGISTGLISPAMAAAVAVGIKRPLQGRINAVINSGTSLGIIAAVPAALLLSGLWRQTYALFAGLALIAVTLAWRLIPRSGQCIATAPDNAQPARRTRSAVTLALFAFATGFTSAVYWTFAPDTAITVGGLTATQASLIWLAVGLGGLGGAAIGDLVHRHGIAMTHGFVMAALSAAIILTAAVPERFILVLFAAAIFGGSYISLTAVYLLAGVQAFADNPALGLTIPFFTIALGQVVGSSVSGYTVAGLGHATAFGIYGSTGLLVSLFSPLMPEAGTTKPPGTTQTCVPAAPPRVGS